MKETSLSTMQASKEALESELSLRLLSEIEREQTVSQRSIAVRLGIAVGLTNAYLKRCVRKGWVKVQQVPARRYAYYVTPQGFAEKTRLVGEYLASSFSFFRKARAQCHELLQRCERLGWRRVALVGDGDLAEIATLAARETGVELVAVIVPGSNAASAAGLPVAAHLDLAPGFDAVLITDIRAPQSAYDELRGRVADARILVPDLLRVSRAPVEGEGER